MVLQLVLATLLLQSTAAGEFCDGGLAMLLGELLTRGSTALRGMESVLTREQAAEGDSAQAGAAERRNS